MLKQNKNFLAIISILIISLTIAGCAKSSKENVKPKELKNKPKVISVKILAKATDPQKKAKISSQFVDAKLFTSKELFYIEKFTNNVPTQKYPVADTPIKKELVIDNGSTKIRKKLNIYDDYYFGPNPNEIAHISDLKNKFQIKILNIKTGQDMVVYTSNYYITDLAWESSKDILIVQDLAPIGSETSDIRGSDYQIATLNLQSKRVKNLLKVKNLILDVRWHPVKNQFSYSYSKSANDTKTSEFIALYSIDKKSQEQLLSKKQLTELRKVDDIFFLDSLSWLKDGSYLAFKLDGETTSNLVLYRTYDKKQFIFEADLDKVAGWSPDNKSVLIIGQNSIKQIYFNDL